MIVMLREFKHERNQMDTVIAEERRTMYTVQHEMSKNTEMIDSNVDMLQSTVNRQQKTINEMH